MSNAFEVNGHFVIGSGGKKRRIVSVKGQEAVSEQFRFSVLFESPGEFLSLDEVVGQDALLTVEGQQGTRYVHGIVAQLQERETVVWTDASTCTAYHALLVPRAWRLRHRHDCRIFQQKNVQEIVAEILDGDGIEYTFTSARNVPPRTREYCVQYRESDWAFVSRLLEEEGYLFYFEHSATRHTLHITNDLLSLPTTDGGGALVYKQPDGRVADQEHVLAFYLGQAVQSGKVQLSDYNFERPSLDLSSQKEGEADTALSVYDYPGKYASPEQGDDLAGIRLEELSARRTRGDGRSVCPRLTAGYMFSLDGHPNRANNRRYLVTRIHHHIEAANTLEAGVTSLAVAYDNRFFCLPEGAPFRPERRTPKPLMSGVQTAVVQGRGEEVDVDRHGRVHVKFHWDRRDGSDKRLTCWIRVSQLWAGAGFGGMFIPRDGHEVIVDFEEGDPDRPIVIGRVYHGQNVPPYDLPKEKTKSTVKSESSPQGGGFNEIRFEDRKGSEEFYTHAQKNQNEVVRATQTTSVGGDRILSVGHDRDTEIGGDDTLKVKGDRKVSVGGGLTTDVGGQRHLTAGGGVVIEGNGGPGIKLVGDPEVRAIGANAVAIKAPTIVLSGGHIVLSGGTIDIKGDVVTIKGKPIKLNC